MPEIIFNGPVGRLEGRYQAGSATNAPICVVLHPHPQHGGTMNNKIAYTLFKAFANSRFSVLRINFRGVGRSEGSYDGGPGELSDAAAAMDWLEVNNADHSGCWIAGFSFGAWIAAQALMRRPEIEGFVLIAPPADHYDFTFLEPCPCDGLIVQGTADDIVSEPAVARLAERLNRKSHDVTYRVFEGAGHFFENDLDRLHRTVVDYVGEKTAGYELVEPPPR